MGQFLSDGEFAAKARVDSRISPSGSLPFFSGSRPGCRSTLMLQQIHLSDKRTKQILSEFLTSEGWEPDISWGANHGIDIEARRRSVRWMIEVNVPELPDVRVVEAFVSALGKLLQRMHDPGSKYSIAVPDSEPFHRLWERLPVLVKKRVGLTVLFVNPTGAVLEGAE